MYLGESKSHSCDHQRGERNITANLTTHKAPNFTPKKAKCVLTDAACFEACWMHFYLPSRGDGEAVQFRPGHWCSRVKMEVAARAERKRKTQRKREGTPDQSSPHDSPHQRQEQNQYYEAQKQAPKLANTRTDIDQCNSISSGHFKRNHSLSSGRGRMQRPT